MPMPSRHRHLVFVALLAGCAASSAEKSLPGDATDTVSVASDTGTPAAADSGSGSSDTAVLPDTETSVDSGSGDTTAPTDTDSGSGSGDTSPPIPETLLFVGNSYTYYNDLDRLVADLGSSLPGAPLVTASRVAFGGYRLPQHATDAATDGTPLAAYLGSGPYPAWTYVVLQDQSQIPGFPATQQERIDSVAAAVTLAGRAAEHSATTLLFQTWGRRDGDSGNPDRFPDFLTMNNLLAEGYAEMEQAILAAGLTVRVVPVGAAFAAIHAEETAAGRNPLDSASLFYRLYAADGSHPSLEGSYLAAVTFVCTLRDNASLPFAFSPAPLVAEDIARLQKAGCDAAKARNSGTRP